MATLTLNQFIQKNSNLYFSNAEIIQLELIQFALLESSVQNALARYPFQEPLDLQSIDSNTQKVKEYVILNQFIVFDAFLDVFLNNQLW